MNSNICNNCGGDYGYRNGKWICMHCGSYRPEGISNEEQTLLFSAFQKVRLAEFNEAELEFDDIIHRYPLNSNGYWGRLLAKYGIKYEEDFDGRKIPTCYATSIDSIMSDKDYLKAVELADADSKNYYRKQAEYIERVRKEWLEKAKKEKPYDIFICYKESDPENEIERTKDSIAAQDLYIHLTEQGYHVFFSHESLRDKAGEKYEPYIFNALSTAKVMLIYGSSSEYITSTWLKNEWSRYEKRIQSGEKKPNSLIVAYDGFSPSELPQALSSKQCLDASQRSFYSDLDTVITKIIYGEKKKSPVVTEKKRKKLPITLATISILIAVIMCILIPNMMTTTITDSQYGVTITASEKIFNTNSALIVDKMTNGVQYRSWVSSVNNAKSVDLQNAIIYDIECGTEISDKVTVKVPYTKSHNTSTVKVFYISDDRTIVEEHNCIYDKETVEFKTSHLSYYVIGEIFNTETPPENNPGNDTDNNDKKITISFNSNGGSGSMDSISASIDESISLPANSFSKSGYTFIGWSDVKNGSLKYNDRQAFQATSSENITLYAVWAANTNTINFDANGGSGSMSSQKAKTDEKISLKQISFTRAGYSFQGWSTSANGAVVYADKAEYTMGLHATVTLYAIWEANTNTINFNANGGSGNMSAQEAKTDENFTLNQNSFTREGYTFAGWAKSATGDVIYSDGASLTMGATSEITLYAVWASNNNALIFNSNGGSGSMESISIATNETIALPFNNFSRSGYTFLGWSDSQNGGVKYIDRQSFRMTSSATLTLYAVWGANTNTINFNSNGGTGSMAAQQAKTDEKVTLEQNSFTYTGYTFKGWSTSANGTVVYADKAEYTMGSDSSITLYAIWEANTNTIHFNANGGNGSMSSQEVKTYETVTLSQNAFTYEGYTFAGWATTADGNVAYVDQASYTVGSESSYTLYAVWIKATYTITYHMNGGSNNINNPAGYDITDETITFANPVRDGYTFLGWFTDSAFQNKITSINQGSTGNKDIYASWSANTNTINFNANGGSGSMSLQEVKTDETVTLYQNTFTYEGYTFAGWATTVNGNMAYADQASYTAGSESSYTLYALWIPIIYEITYDLQGGTIIGEISNYDINTNSFTLPIPTKENYIFLGWSGTDISGIQKNITISQGSIGNRNYIANWEYNSYTITLNANFGTVEIYTQEVTYGKEYTISPANRPGYLFIGWFDSLDENANIFTDSDGKSLTVWNKMENTTFYAHWEPDFSEGLNYTKLEGWVNGKKLYAYEVSGIGTCTDIVLRLPVEIDGIPVISIGKNAFLWNTTIESVVFPEVLYESEYSIYSNFNHSNGILIKEDAFCSCTNLKTVILNRVSKIEKRAFHECAKLETVQINKDSILQSIGMFCFEDCVALQTIIIPVNCIVGESAFYETPQLSIYCEASSQPETWATNWNALNNPVYWGYIFNSNKVDFDYDGATDNTSVAYKFVEMGSTYTFPVPTKIGYTFAGWYHDATPITNEAGTMLSIWNIDSNCILKAKWIANTNTAYTVRHYLENANDSRYTLTDTETLYGTTDSSVSPNTKTYTGFNAPSKVSVKILPDGSAVLEYHYTRITHTVTFVTNGGDAIDTMTVKYQQAITMPNASRDGFTFGGWFTDGALSEQFVETTVSTNTTLYAWWEEENKPTDFQYNIAQTGVKICGNNSALTNLVIPAFIGGYEVTEILSNGFKNYLKLSAVNIPNTLIIIGESAFEGCTNLNNLDIPESVTTIKSYAFSKCYKLTDIVIPVNVTTIGGCIFQDCISMKSVTILNPSAEVDLKLLSGSQNVIVKSYTYSDAHKAVLYASAGKWAGSFESIGEIENIRIWDSGSCGDYLYWELDINGTLRIFGEGLMKDYGNVSNLSPWYIYRSYIHTAVLGEGILSIGDQAFFSCTELEKVYFPDSLLTIDNDAFYHSSNRFDIYITNIEMWCNLSIPFANFVGCLGKFNLYLNDVIVDEIIIPDTVSVISQKVFNGCQSLREITISDSVESIEDFAFYECTHLTSISISNSVTNIGRSAFEYCQSLTEIIFRGTMAEWDAITFGNEWNSNIAAIVVVCTDGVVTIS